MTALAQKGLDYDRLREKYDEFKPVMDHVQPVREPFRHEHEGLHLLHPPGGEKSPRA